MYNLKEIHSKESFTTLDDIKNYLKIRIILLLIQIIILLLLVIGIFDFSSSVRSMTKSIEHSTYHSNPDCCYSIYN